jgi:molecular chaperone GrpE
LNSKAASAEAGSIDESVIAPVVDGLDWQSKALELRAEMDNFRKRQARRAEEAAAAEQERLLRLILPVADNLARALNHDDQADTALQQGVELTYRELIRSLEAEGVTRFETVGQPFDPNLHEAIATRAVEVAANTIVEEIEAGYRLGDKLLRPARVVVAM